MGWHGQRHPGWHHPRRLLHSRAQQRGAWRVQRKHDPRRQPCPTEPAGRQTFSGWRSARRGTHVASGGRRHAAEPDRDSRLTQPSEILDEVRLDRHATLISAIDRCDALELPLESVRVSFLRNIAVEPIRPFLKYHLYRSDLRGDINVGGYGTIREEILDPQSHLYASEPQLIALALHLPFLAPGCYQSSWSPQGLRSDLDGIVELLLSKTNALIALNTFVLPFHSETGIARNPSRRGLISKVRELNEFLHSLADRHPSRTFVVDWANIVDRLGEHESIDYRYLYMYRTPFKAPFWNQYALELAKILRALQGKSKKCLILDCDNTLWGGTIGEDGLDRLHLDPHEYPGNAYYEFQKGILQLVERGVLVALCSKNNESDALDVLGKHPHCLLKPQHLAAWRINWQNKADNILSIASELNLGLDSMVFVDDDPRECELVRQRLPAVTVLSVPERTYTLPPLLFREGLFDALTLSAEDSQRTEMIRADRARERHRDQCGELAEYLASLRLRATVHRALPGEFARLAQLCQRTNQFNLTTRRYQEADISAFASDPNRAVFSLSVEDRFGPSGLTGLLIAERQGDTGFVDTLLLSCRVLGKNYEIAFVDHCLTLLAEEWALRTWESEYRPTPKNAQVADFWPRVGLKETMRDAEGTRYCAQVAQRRSEPSSYIQVTE